ncbi:MAG: hypothetical protein MR503_02965 [Oscillospiraceae bacterium]|nr:hypothetical protein [Oscillospiraceae bacterium]
MNNINDINKVNVSNPVLISGKTAAETAKISAAEKTVAEKIKSDEKEVRTDSFTKSAETKTEETGIYSRESLLEQLRNSEEQRVKAFEDTIRSMVAQQGQVINFTFRGQGLHVTEEQRAEAEKSISEGGEYSVDSVAGRIMDMAKALAGEDSSKISMLREAVQKGFSGAASLLGKKDDEMPEITKNTYTEVMKRFDDWENSFKEKAEAETKTDETVKTETETE